MGSGSKVRKSTRSTEDTRKYGEEQGEDRDTNGVSAIQVGDQAVSELNAEAGSSTIDQNSFQNIA